jgi:hypothetical protein
MEIRNLLGLKMMTLYLGLLSEVILDNLGVQLIQGRDLVLLTSEQLSKVKLGELTKGLNKETEDKKR